MRQPVLKDQHPTRVMTANEDVLNSWKEVASYLGRGVRTVQRWEQELGLPVRRPRGKSRSAVIAFKPELDQWLRRAPAQQLDKEHPDDVAPTPGTFKYSNSKRQARLHESTQVLMGRTRVLLARSSDLCDKLKDLQESVQRTVTLTASKMQRHAKNPGFTFVVPPPLWGSRGTAEPEARKQNSSDRQLVTLAS